jgi:putative FmdB family regulatory protein
MLTFDYSCKNCGNEEINKDVKKYDEEVICPMCEHKMEKLYTGFQCKPGTRHHRPYPSHLVGKGDVKFGKE